MRVTVVALAIRRNHLGLLLDGGLLLGLGGCLLLLVAGGLGIDPVSLLFIVPGLVGLGFLVVLLRGILVIFHFISPDATEFCGDLTGFHVAVLVLDFLPHVLAEVEVGRHGALGTLILLLGSLLLTVRVRIVCFLLSQPLRRRSVDLHLLLVALLVLLRLSDEGGLVLIGHFLPPDATEFLCYLCALPILVLRLHAGPSVFAEKDVAGAVILRRIGITLVVLSSLADRIDYLDRHLLLY